MSSLDYKKFEVIVDVLDLQLENGLKSLEEYLSNVNNDRLQVMFDKFKERLGVKAAFEYITIITDLCKFNMNNDFLEGLLSDDDVVEYVSNTKNKAGIISRLKEVLAADSSVNKEEEKEDLSDVVDEALKEQSKEDIDRFGKYPIYGSKEEKEAFGKYAEMRQKLEAYIESRSYMPEIQDFKDFIENRYVDSKDGVDRSKTKDPFIVKTIMALYSRPRLPKDQPIVDLMKDPYISDLIDEMKELRDDICFHNMRLVISVAKKYVDRGVPIDDLVQEGSIGLNKAIDKYDPARGNRFSTMAVTWIKQAVTRSLMNDSSVIRIPVHLSGIGNKVKKAERLLRNEDLIEEPSIEEIYEKCKELGFDLSFTQVKSYKKASLISDTISANKAVGEEEDSELIDFIPSTAIESPEAYAGYLALYDEINHTVDDIAAGKLAGSRGEYYKRTYNFKQIIFTTTEGKLINIILSQTEYAKYLKNLNSEDGKERFTEFVKRYGLNPDKLTTKITKRNIILTKDQREALIYKTRRGLIDDFIRMFISGRNYNNVLFDDSNSNKDYTLGKVGALFEVTRERIRQIDARCDRKVQRLNQVEVHESVKSNPDYVIKHLYIGDPLQQNIFSILNVVRKPEYVPVAPSNKVVEIDKEGNIKLLDEGAVTVYLKNIATGKKRELRLVVHRVKKDAVTEFMEKKTEEKTLKLINEDNKKDNQ